MVNRCIATVRVREPFLEWLRGLLDPCDFGLDVINDDNTAYLLPEYEDDHQRDRILIGYFNAIFEEQLASWWTDERDWPSKRSLQMFKQWFDIEFHSVVLDLVDDELLDDE